MFNKATHVFCLLNICLLVSVFVIPAQAQDQALMIKHGQLLYTRFGCGGCHKINGKGGEMGPDLSLEGNKTAQMLSFNNVIGEKTVENWLVAYFLGPQHIFDENPMPNYQMTQIEAQALTAYMLSLKGEFSQEEEPLDGKDIFKRYCSYCHGPAGEGVALASFGLTGPGILNTDYLRVAQPDYIRHMVTVGRSTRQMPGWLDSFSADEMDTLLAYIDSHRPRAAPLKDLPSGDVAIGQKVFARNCDVCHGDQVNGIIGSRLKSPYFLRVADDAFLHAMITKGVPNTPMASWADLPEEELAGLLALFGAWRKELGVTVLQNPPEIRTGSKEKGAELYDEFCASCHGDKGQGKRAMALHNQVLLEHASPAFLIGSLDRCRTKTWGAPPTFKPEERGALVAFLQSWRGKPRPVVAGLYRPLEMGNIDAGQTLFAEKCAGCHGDAGVNGYAPAIGGLELLHVVSDGFLAASLTIGRSNTIMKPRGLNASGHPHPRPLTSEEILDVVAYLRSNAIAPTMQVSPKE